MEGWYGSDMFLIQKQKYSKGDKNLGLLQTSGAALAEAIGYTIYTPKFKPRRYQGKPIINWGCSHILWLEDDSFCFNKPEAVLNSSNKIKAFKLMYDCGVKVVPFTTIRAMAEALFDSGSNRTKVVCRKIVSGSCGDGIIIAHNKEELVDAPLYTLYVEKKWEYRVHVAFGEVIHVQQKRRLSSEQLEIRGIFNRDKYVRNVANGYIFSTEIHHHSDEFILEDLYDQSLLAIQSLSLDFGAVDLLVTRDNEVKVLEVNSAPGLEGITLSNYVSHFKKHLIGT